MTYMWNLKHDTNELNYETDRLTEQRDRLVVVGAGTGGRTGSWGSADAN